jgi:hypothetical protein
MPRKHDIKELQKTATFSTAYTLRKVLIWKYKTFIMGNSNNNSSSRCKNSITATTTNNNISITAAGMV